MVADALAVGWMVVGEVRGEGPAVAMVEENMVKAVVPRVAMMVEGMELAAKAVATGGGRGGGQPAAGSEELTVGDEAREGWSPRSRRAIDWRQLLHRNTALHRALRSVVPIGRYQ